MTEGTKGNLLAPRINMAAVCRNLIFHLASRVNEPFYSWLNAMVNCWKLAVSPEKKTRLGKLNRDKTFYVIRDFPDTVGLAGWYDRVIGYIIRAEKKGWIPVIDCPANALGQSWELFFENLTSVPLREVMQSENVVFAHRSLAVVYKRLSAKNISIRHAIAKNYIRLKPDVADFINGRMGSMLPARPVVGAYLRGTDYRAQGTWRPVGHAIVPGVDYFARRLREDCSKWGVDIKNGECLFIVTEEQELLDGLLARFPAAQYVRKERYSRFSPVTCLPKQQLPHTSAEENNRLYLLDLYILSECRYLAGPMNGGIQMALNLNGGNYKDVDIIDLGTH